jgi:leucyl aminopeptidase
MEAQVKLGAVEKIKTACLVVAVFEGLELSGEAEVVNQACGGLLTRLHKRGDFDGRAGQATTLLEIDGIGAERLILLGCGRRADFAERHFRRAVQEALLRAQETGATEATLALTDLEVAGRNRYWKARQLVEVAGDVGYRFDRLKSRKDRPRGVLARVVIAVADKRQQTEVELALKHGRALVNAMNRMRDLANLPSNICTPPYLAEEARALARSHTSIKATVLGPERMTTLGMHSLLAVAQGSAHPAQLIVLEYKGATPRTAAPVVLVGKGVTFDTGGISIKPSEAMDEMKYDMCGAASVIATVAAAAELKLPINLVGVIPAVENMPSGTAVKPGDIVTSLSGQTIEILNTDAEGRLILCDAMTYAERYKPAVMIDIATLTGACVVALGRQAHGLFSNDDNLALELLAAGRASHDRAWHMPVWEEYQQQLDSNFADMANIGGREAGAVTAACFLARFARQQHWAHLDIAGTAWRSGKEKGATGRPVPLLLQFLLQRAGQVPE